MNAAVLCLHHQRPKVAPHRIASLLDDGDEEEEEKKELSAAEQASTVAPERVTTVAPNSSDDVEILEGHEKN